MALAIVTKSAEVKLMESLNAIDDPARWHAIDFHLALLLPEYQSDYQIKIAINLINDLLKSYDGGVFLLRDRGIVVLASGLEKTLLNKLIFQMRYLYMDDPLAYTAEGQENPAFCTAYDFARDWQPFMDISSRRMAMSMRNKLPLPQAGEGRGEGPSSLHSIAKQPVLEKPAMIETAQSALSAASMVGIERDLRQADLSRVIRRQPVCAAMPGQTIRRVFDELYIYIARLRQTLKTDVDFFSNRWLFKYLTQILDERMIALIRQHPDQYLSSPVSLNLNVETLLSSAFAELDAIIRPEIKVSVVIEVPVVDVFADIAGFMVAKKEVQKLGYRVCLDGLTTQSFINISREKLGFDLVKVQWNADIESDLLKTRENQELAAAVQHSGANRVILCRCDNRAAVEYGQAMGISLFQGRYLDSVLNPTGASDN